MSIRRFGSTSITSTGGKSSKLWDGETFPGYFESIATYVVPSGGTSSITFSDIPQTYTHLQLRGFHQEPSDSVEIQFNGSTSNVYTNHAMFGDGGDAFSQYTSQSLSQYGIVVGTNYGSSGSNFGACVVDIFDYTKTNKNKIVRSLTGADSNGSYSRVGIYSGLFFSTNAITSIRIFPRTTSNNLAQYSHFALYGIRGA